MLVDGEEDCRPTQDELSEANPQDSRDVDDTLIDANLSPAALPVQPGDPQSSQVELIILLQCTTSWYFLSVDKEPNLTIH